MTPAGTSNELDVQNEWEENTHTTLLTKGFKERPFLPKVFFAQLCCTYSRSQLIRHEFFIPFFRRFAPILFFNMKSRYICIHFEVYILYTRYKSCNMEYIFSRKRDVVFLTISPPLVSRITRTLFFSLLAERLSNQRSGPFFLNPNP